MDLLRAINVLISSAMEIAGTMPRAPYIMAEGKVLIAGTAQELITDPRAREIYLGEKFRL